MYSPLTQHVSHPGHHCALPAGPHWAQNPLTGFYLKPFYFGPLCLPVTASSQTGRKLKEAETVIHALSALEKLKINMERWE
jgi:hypothetical protein